MSAILPMPALSDLEDANPAYRIRSMSDTETVDTIAPPTDREAKTDPAAARETMLPEADVAAIDKRLSELIRRVVDAATTLEADRADKQSSLRNQSQLIEQQNEILLAIQAADRNNISGWKTMSHQLEVWRKAFEAKNDLQDEQLAAHTTEIADVRASIDTAIDKLRADMIDKLFEIQRSLEPFAQRLDDLEKLAREPTSDTAPTPATA